jgi:hypothetical protein
VSDECVASRRREGKRIVGGGGLPKTGLTDWLVGWPRLAGNTGIRWKGGRWTVDGVIGLLGDGVVIGRLGGSRDPGGATQPAARAARDPGWADGHTH